MFSGNPGNSARGSGDIVAQIKDWFLNCPPFTKGLIYICSVLALLHAISSFSVLLMNIPIYTISGFQLHRLIFSPFGHSSIFLVLFAFLAYLPMCSRQEKSWGTTKTIIDFFWKNLLVNVAFCCFAYIFSPITPYFINQACSGLFQIFFVQLVEICLANPEGISMLLCLPIQIKTKYYPIALFLLFSLFSMSIRWDHLIAMGVGYAHYQYINAHYLSFLNDRRVSSWEDSFLFAWLKGLPNYAPLGGSAGSQSSSNTGTTPGRVIASVHNADNQPAASQFGAFKGKGVTIGESNENTNTGKSGKKEKYVQLNDDTEDLEEGGTRNESQ